MLSSSIVFMDKGISSAVAFTLVLVIVIATSVGLFLWASNTQNPELHTEYLRIDAYSLNSTAIKVINMDTENSSSLLSMDTSVGDCDFPAPTILQPGIGEICILSNAVSGGTTITIYADGIRQARVDF